MKKLYFVTGNQLKFAIAHDSCAKHGVELEQLELDVDEIQGEDATYIVRDKALRAYALAGKPVVVSDDSWSMLGLRGFPGPYMKSMNHWFTVDDFVRLTRDVEDRRIELHAHLAYCDENGVVPFSQVFPGTLLKKPKGSYDVPCAQIFALDGDNGLSIAEVYERGMNNAERPSSQIWHEFAEWYKSRV